MQFLIFSHVTWIIIHCNDCFINFLCNLRYEPDIIMDTFHDTSQTYSYRLQSWLGPGLLTVSTLFKTDIRVLIDFLMINELEKYLIVWYLKKSSSGCAESCECCVPCERLLTGLVWKSSNYDELAGYWFLDEFLSCLGSIIVLIHSSSAGTGNTGIHYIVIYTPRRYLPTVI